MGRAEGVIAAVQTQRGPCAVGLKAGGAQGAVHGGTGDACVTVGGVIRPGGKSAVGLIAEAVVRLRRGVDLLAKKTGDCVSVAGKQSNVDGQDELTPLAGLRSVEPREVGVSQGTVFGAQQLDFLGGDGGGEPGGPPVQGLEVTVCGFGESGETIRGGSGYGGDVAGVFGFTVEFGFLEGADAVSTLKREDVAGDGRFGTLSRAILVGNDLVERKRIEVGLEARYELAQVLAVRSVRQESPLDALEAVAERPQLIGRRFERGIWVSENGRPNKTSGKFGGPGYDGVDIRFGTVGDECVRWDDGGGEGGGGHLGPDRGDGVSTTDGVFGVGGDYGVETVAVHTFPVGFGL